MAETCLRPVAGAAAFAGRVGFLSEPRNHPYFTARVQVVETHRSWVFLTEAHAYKLKKPIRLNGQDLASLAARAEQCRLEVALNRRLAPDVYLGAIPLAVGADGRLAIDGGGEPVDWLVWMRRLPERLMLDRQLARGGVDMVRLRQCVARIARFHRTQPPELLSLGGFRGLLLGKVEENERALLACAPLPEAAARAVCSFHRRFIAARGAWLEQRLAEGRVVEGHGDLRPEHVCLEAPPKVIDCLEFSRELRVLDGLEEAAFLALECERLGAPEIGALVLHEHARASDDEPPPALVSFYQSLHAAIRAKLAVWHAGDPGTRGAAHWAARAAALLELAGRHAAAAQAAGG